MNFEEDIKKWVTLDNEIRTKSTELRQLREERRDSQIAILEHVSTNGLSHKTIQISDGTLKFQNIKVATPPTFKFITQCLTDCISDEGQVTQLVDYIKQKREIKYIPEVKRSYK